MNRFYHGEQARGSVRKEPGRFLCMGFGGHSRFLAVLISLFYRNPDAVFTDGGSAFSCFLRLWPIGARYNLCILQAYAQQ